MDFSRASRSFGAMQKKLYKKPEPSSLMDAMSHVQGPILGRYERPEPRKMRLLYWMLDFYIWHKDVLPTKAIIENYYRYRWRERDDILEEYANYIVPGKIAGTLEYDERDVAWVTHVLEGQGIISRFKRKHHKEERAKHYLFPTSLGKIFLNSLERLEYYSPISDINLGALHIYYPWLKDWEERSIASIKEINLKPKVKKEFPPEDLIIMGQGLPGTKLTIDALLECGAPIKRGPSHSRSTDTWNQLEKGIAHMNKFPPSAVRKIFAEWCNKLINQYVLLGIKGYTYVDCVISNKERINALSDVAVGEGALKRENEAKGIVKEPYTSYLKDVRLGAVDGQFTHIVDTMPVDAFIEYESDGKMIPSKIFRENSIFIINKDVLERNPSVSSRLLSAFLEMNSVLSNPYWRRYKMVMEWRELCQEFVDEYRFPRLREALYSR